jgi:hypothetical protein
LIQRQRFYGQVNGLSGQVNDLSGQVNGLSGQVNDLKGTGFSPYISGAQ